MADKSYKLTLYLSDGTILNAGTITAPQGPSGANGVTFTPSVSSAGVLSWTNNGGLTNPTPISIKGPKGDDAVITESDVAGWGFTKNTGTITGIKMNGASKGTSGVVDLGTVLTAHQDISGKANLAGGNTFTGDQYFGSGNYRFETQPDGEHNFIIEDYKGDGLVRVNPNGFDLDFDYLDTMPFLIQGNAGTSGQVLTSQGAGKTPKWLSSKTLDKSPLTIPNAKIPLSRSWVNKTWSGLTNFSSRYIWTDGDNIYYSNGTSHYVLNKSTSKWTAKTWSGLTSFNGYDIWTDGNNIYYSNGASQYILRKSTSTWVTKTWSGLTSFEGRYIWTDGDSIYYSLINNQYVLDKSTSTWTAKTWSGRTNINADSVWTDGDNIYYSYNTSHYVLDKSTSTWVTKTWNGLSVSASGTNIWTDGDNIYCSNGSIQYVLDKSTSTWTAKTWSGRTNINADSVWTDGDNIYYSNGASQFVLRKNTSTRGTNLGSIGFIDQDVSCQVLTSNTIDLNTLDVGVYMWLPTSVSCKITNIYGTYSYSFVCSTSSYMSLTVTKDSSNRRNFCLSYTITQSGNTVSKGSTNITIHQNGTVIFKTTRYNNYSTFSENNGAIELLSKNAQAGDLDILFNTDATLEQVQVDVNLSVYVANSSPTCLLSPTLSAGSDFPCVLAIKRNRQGISMAFTGNGSLLGSYTNGYNSDIYTGPIDLEVQYDASDLSTTSTYWYSTINGVVEEKIDLTA